VFCPFYESVPGNKTLASASVYIRNTLLLILFKSITMRKLYSLLTGILLAATSLSAQDLSPLTPYQMDQLRAVPEARMPLSRAPITLPVSVDNSTLPYFRPLFTQSGLECGQASSIGLGLTYELDLKRNLPANVPQNQYATYFTYNWLNQGSDAGCSFLESWEIVKRCGNPTVSDYGGLSAGGPSRWMNGYDKYYNSMHNRITDVAVIYLNTFEGLNALKSWIHNHMDQATIGGVAHFYSQYGSVNNQLPAGTPLAGQYVLTSWGSSPNHAMTILGYNDSIRWDYNGDGQYTNNIDINGDGIISLKDWEIGGFKIANTYGNVGNWANQGFAWAMYKSFADNTSSGGIWNNAAYIAYAKQDLQPKLTMKITLKHTSRNKLKVIAGVSTDPSATEPETTLNLPILDYQGGEKYMQGGTTEADKTLEFGLDITPLLSEINSGQPAKFFLSVQENDPSNAGTGQITSFDLINYTSGAVTIPSGYSNVPLVENGVTTLSVIATINVDKPVINTNSLPDAKIYEPYSQALSVSGGTPPYKWRMKVDYEETASTSSFPAISGQQLSLTGNSSGYATKDLPFAFPFYGKAISTVYPHVDGYLMFEDHPVPWPYIIYERTFFKTTRCISPYMGKPLVIEGGDGDGIWYQGSADSASFRWKVSVYGATGSTDLNFAVTLYPDGRIRFYYGTISSTGSVKWISGISNGDGVNYLLTSITDNLAQPAANSSFLFTTQDFPTEMSISDNGVFSGTPAKTYVNLPLKFYVEDNNFLYTTKTLLFNTKGVEISFQVQAGNDSIIEYGETVLLTPSLKNVSNSALHNVVMHLGLPDPYTQLTDSVEVIGTLNPGQLVSFPGAFSFIVSNSIPDNHILNLNSQVVATEDVFNRTLQVAARSAKLVVSNVAVLDGNNNILMPGESGTLQVSLQNQGGSEALNIASLLSTIDPYLVIYQDTASIVLLEAGSTQVLSFGIQATSSCPNGHIGFMQFELEADKDITLSDSVYLIVGTLVEDFETGNYTRFPWQFSGNSNWNITLNQPWEGTYCSQSGTILDNQECSMYLTMDVLSASEISFYRKVSSENNYDFLYFYIDGQEMGKWAGDVPWSKVTFPVQAGSHTFRWKYKKDYSVSTGADKAWVDYISWPPLENMLLIAYAGPDDIACSGQGYTLSGQVINASSVWWSTSGDGSFINGTSPTAVYYPGPTDLASGMVTLTLHATQPAVPPVSDQVILSVFPGPSADAGPDLATCPGVGISLASASATNPTSLVWTSSGDGMFDDPYALHPTYTPGYNDQNNGFVTLTLSVTGNPACNAVSDAMALNIYPAVTANAGIDQTISYNTSTQLEGSASGGSGTFTAAWEPAALLVDPGVFNPVTINLTSSQVFTLTATNNLTGCSSQDEVSVLVTGGPLGVAATATPAAICKGGSSQLNAVGSGGSGVYTYQWSSNPAGFTSTLQNPVVSPEVSTVYTVLMNDGFASVSSSASVTVNDIPAAPSTPSGPVAVNVLITPASSYSTMVQGSVTQYNWLFEPSDAGTIVPSGNTCQVLWNPVFSGTAHLSVQAMNECGSGPVSEVLDIVASPEVGTEGAVIASRTILYPNPSNGKFRLRAGLEEEFSVQVYDQSGRCIYAEPAMPWQMVTEQPFDFSWLLNGNYMIVLRSEKHTIHARFTIIR